MLIANVCFFEKSFCKFMYPLCWSKNYTCVIIVIHVQQFSTKADKLFYYSLIQNMTDRHASYLIQQTPR